MNEDNYQAPALKKGLQVLEFLSGKTEPYALSELARALGKSRNEIYRMVLVLEQLGYLARTDTDRYALTRKLFDLAMRTPPQRNLLIRGLPVMERLSRETLQSCHLMVVSGPDIVVVAHVETPDVLGFSVRVGYRRPLNQSAAGRVLYASQDEAERVAWRALLSSEEDQERWEMIEREAEAIREMGILLSASPYVDAVTDIAAPIRGGPAGLPLAALVMPFIGGRSAKLSLSQAAIKTREAAQRISEELA
jgi:DNA-binding IclR family transcriptional regulator